MGNFYTNITVNGRQAEVVSDAMRALGRESYVLESEADSVVFDRETDEQDTEVLSALADHLSSELQTTTFAVLNHDDDLLWFQLFRMGELISEYANRGGPSTRIVPLCRALEAPGAPWQIWLTLKRPYVFQVSRHLRLVALLGLPLYSVAMGFNYVDRGDLPPDVSEDRLLRVRPGGA